jgi:hypothetical protein
MGEVEGLPQKVGGVVPYFFYDLYGRILPGLFLWCGLIAAWWQTPVVQRFVCAVRGLSATGWAFGSLMALAACFLAGFLLSDLTRITLWKLVRPISIKQVRGYFGTPADQKSALETAFESYFGFPMTRAIEEDQDLIWAARLCEFVIVSQNPAMDSVLTRVAAEELLSRSLMVASSILAPISACHGTLVASVAYVVIGYLSFSSYKHYRQKGFRERFQTFYALVKSSAYGGRPGSSPVDQARSGEHATDWPWRF